MLLALITAFAVSAAGHSAFSKGPQDAGAGLQHFSLSAEPTPLPALPVQDADGRDVMLADRDGLMLVNIWATWCAPCVEEMPSLDALQGRLGGEEFTVVTVSLDRKGMEVVAPFFEKTGIENLTPYIDTTGEFSRAAGATGLPVSFLVKDGRILGKSVGPEDWSSDAAVELIRNHLR